MGEIDFFLDSGIIYGQCDHSDPYYKGCSNHLKNYPYGTHHYCAVKRIALKEVKNIRINKRTRPGGNPHKACRMEAARIIQEVNGLFELDKIKDVDYKGIHASFEVLYNKIHSYLEENKKDNNKKDMDADILTNAFIWDKEMGILYKPHFVTIDIGDIISNKGALITNANDYLKNTPRLKFCLIPRENRAS
jgi:hypothetical protein